MGIRSRLLGAIDRFIVSATEVGKAIVRETIRLVSQITDSTSAALLTIVNHNVYYAARRNRIHTGPEYRPEAPTHKASGFARLFDGSAMLDEHTQWPMLQDHGKGDSCDSTTEHAVMQLEGDRHGLLSESMMFIMVTLEWFSWRARRLCMFILGGRDDVAETTGVPLNTSLREFRSRNVRRRGNFSDLVKKAGYPFKEYLVRTDDGYLIELHRLPRPQSKNVMFLQHGVMDSSYSFIANGASDGLAFRAFDKGYDVFMGNFRGTSSLKHVQANISAKDYWDYTLDDHGNYDVSAFIKEIRHIKLEELLADPNPSLFTPSPGIRRSPTRTHTGAPTGPSNAGSPAASPLPNPAGASPALQPGGAAVQPSALNRAAGRGGGGKVLWKGTPAGGGDARGLGPDVGSSTSADSLDGGLKLDMETEEEVEAERRGKAESDEELVLDITAVAHSMGAAATLIYLVGRARKREPHHLSRVVLMSPAGYHRRIPRLCKLLGPVIYATLSKWTYTLSIPWDRARNLGTRVFTDAVSLPALRDVIYSFGETFLGGDFKETLHSHINIVTENMIAGTSSQVFRQFWNCYLKGKFLSYDYGPEQNMRAYGTDTPLDYFSLYHLIDVPIHFMGGLNDNLIPAKDALKHYKVLHRFHPELATCMPFAGKGHIDFTYGLDREISHQIFSHAGPAGARSVAGASPRTPNLSNNRQPWSSPLTHQHVRNTQPSPLVRPHTEGNSPCLDGGGRSPHRGGRSPLGDLLRHRHAELAASAPNDVGMC